MKSQSSRFGTIRTTILVACAALTIVSGLLIADWYPALPTDAPARFVGREKCVDCHREIAEKYRGSHHDRAMDLATDESVRADFSGVTLEHHGVTSRFFRDGTKFMVHTEGPTGQMEDFEVKYVFGYEPLQQYMVEFDRPADMPADEVARVQVLRLCWDTTDKKWFHLDPPDVSEKLEPDDDLHWTGIAQRWQTMCANCHSTNLLEGFDTKTASYHTTFSEIDVSCEACHGPGSLHVEIAQNRKFFWDRNHGYGLTNPLKGTDPEPQLQTCAHCHSRRQMLATGFVGSHYWDTHDLERLNPETYFADGQVRDEVYVFGSFTQSKMYHKGIRCTDCHDPHSLQLKAPGNQVCTSCHQHPAGKYDTPSHHHHKPGTEAAQCVNCHMPSRTYMAVDPRRDHSLRIPRPDLSVKLGTPNACTACHLEPNNVDPSEREKLKEYADWQRLSEQGSISVTKEIQRANQWCDEACDRWYGETRNREPHFATAFAAAIDESKDAAAQLSQVAQDRAKTPAIARATAIDLLARIGAGVSATGLAEFSNDPHPLVRASAVTAMRARNAKQAARALGPLLDDASKLVRVRTAQALLNTPMAEGDPQPAFQELSRTQQEKLQLALKELYESLMASNDRAGAHLSWALTMEGYNDLEGAIQAYETAIRVEPLAVGSRTNLAGLLERMAESNRFSPEQLLQVQLRVKQLRQEELPLLERDAKLAPNLPDLHFRVGQLRYLTGDATGAVEPIARAVQLSPEEPSFRLFYALLLQKVGMIQEAKKEAETLNRLQPNVPSYQQLLEELSAAASSQRKS